MYRFPVWVQPQRTRDLLIYAMSVHHCPPLVCTHTGTSLTWAWAHTHTSCSWPEADLVFCCKTVIGLLTEQCLSAQQKAREKTDDNLLSPKLNFTLNNFDCFYYHIVFPSSTLDSGLHVLGDIVVPQSTVLLLSVNVWHKWLCLLWFISLKTVRSV